MAKKKKINAGTRSHSLRPSINNERNPFHLVASLGCDQQLGAKK